MEIKITMQELENMLHDQKRLVIERLSSNTHLFNTESTAVAAKPLPLDKERFSIEGFKTAYPNEFNTLKKYVL